MKDRETRQAIFLRAASFILAGAMMLALACRPALARQAPPLILVIDASITMEDTLISQLKYKVVRKTFRKLLAQYDGQLEVALTTFGSRQQRACDDISTILPPQTLDAKTLFYRLDGIKPRGRSPIAAALENAAALAQGRPANILLIADGADNCGRDVCEAAAGIHQRARNIRIHVIGLGDYGGLQRLSCISQQTGGEFQRAMDQSDLQTALQRSLLIAQHPINVTPPPPPDPKPEAEVAKKTERRMQIGKPPLPKRKSARKTASRLEQPGITGSLQSGGATSGEQREREEMVVEVVPTPAPTVQQHTEATPSPAAKPVATQKVKPPAPATPVTPAAPPKDAKAPAAAIPRQPFGDQQPEIRKELGSATAPVTLVAMLTEGGREIRSGLIWRIYNARRDPRGHFKLLHKLTTPYAQVDLPIGAYLVNAAWGRSHLTEKIDILESKPVRRNLVLNAGGLRLGAQHLQGMPLLSNRVTYQIFSDERDQFGSRRLLVDKAPPGRIIRLNAGIYHVKSRYGAANGYIETDVTVEAGKLTEAIINHTATKVTFKLVNQPDGEALAGAVWQILTPDGKLVKRAGGALPSMILAAGDYAIQAQYGGRTFARKVTIEPGDPIHVEIVIQ